MIFLSKKLYALSKFSSVSDLSEAEADFRSYKEVVNSIDSGNVKKILDILQANEPLIDSDPGVDEDQLDKFLGSLKDIDDGFELVIGKMIDYCEGRFWVNESTLKPFINALKDRLANDSDDGWCYCIGRKHTLYGPYCKKDNRAGTSLGI